jgi:K+-sensing histidine kinase KdpD
VLFIDSGLLCIAIANLLDNAVKYAAAGEIRVEIYQQEKHVELRIGDRGPGIPPEQVEHIYERYRRGETHTATPAGTGLGCMSPDKSSRLTAGTCGWQKIAQPDANLRSRSR